MAKPLADAIVTILRDTFENSLKRRKVTILLDTKPDIVLATSALGCQTIVLGDRFRLLYRTYRKIEKKKIPQPLIIESSFDTLPIKANSLDAIVITRDIFSSKSPLDSLVEIRQLLKANGVMIWPQLSPNRMQRVSRIGTHGVERSDLTSLSMEAGFAEIGQNIVSSRLVTWIITTARNKNRP